MLIKYLLKSIQVDVVMESFIKEMRQAGNNYHQDPNSKVKELSHLLNF